MHEGLVKDSTTLLSQQQITDMLECIRRSGTIKRLANEPWNESIRTQSRSPKTPMLPFFPSICFASNPANQLALPTLIGPRSMESILQSHSSFLRIEDRPAASLPVRDFSQFSFSLLNTLQGKGGTFGARPLGISWAKTLQKERASNTPRDQDSLAIVPYQGPTATVRSENVVPAEWIMALSLAMAAIQHNVVIPSEQKRRRVPSSSFEDQQHDTKRKRETRDDLALQPTARQFFLAKSKTDQEEKMANMLSDDTTHCPKVTFAQAANMPHNGHQLNLGDVARVGEGQVPGPTSEQSGVEAAKSEAGRLDSSRKRDREERKKERKEKRARKKAKKIEKKLKRSESHEPKSHERDKDGHGPPNVQPPVATDRRKAPPDSSSFAVAVAESQQTANRDSSRNAVSLQFVDEELDKARTTLLKKARERSREAISNGGIPRATLPSTYDRGSIRPTPQTIQRSVTAPRTLQTTSDLAQRQPSTSTSLSQMQRNDSVGWNRQTAPDETPQHSQGLQAPQQGAIPWSWSRQQEGNGQTQLNMASNPNVLHNGNVRHPGSLPKQQAGYPAPRAGHEMHFLQANVAPTISNVAEGRLKNPPSQNMQQGFAPFARDDNSGLPGAVEQHERALTEGQPGGVSGYHSFQGNIQVEAHLLQEDRGTDHSRLPAVKLLCSEEFIETRGDVFAELASGRWAHFLSGDDGANAIQTARCLGRKVELRDTPLVDKCGVDIELPNRRAVLLYNVSTLEVPQQARVVVIGLAQLVAMGRYKHVDVILCYDVPVTSPISLHIVQLQTAVMSNGGSLSTSTFFKTASPASLSAVIAQTVFVHNQVPCNPLSEPSTKVLADTRIREWSRFLLSLLPTLCVHGAIQCIQLTQQMGHSGPSFGLLFQSAQVRQQIMLAATSNPCRAPAVHPHAMGQLSHILRVSIGKSPHHEA
jgi:hypothetical protein